MKPTSRKFGMHVVPRIKFRIAYKLEAATGYDPYNSASLWRPVTC